MKRNGMAEERKKNVDAVKAAWHDPSIRKLLFLDFVSTKDLSKEHDCFGGGNNAAKTNYVKHEYLAKRLPPLI